MDISVKETCVICFQKTDTENIFSVDECRHRYCFSCMRKHVQVKLRNGMVPKCPHQGCYSKLDVERCYKFLTFELIEKMTERINEASIPVSERVYCPYPYCSALMSNKQIGLGSQRCFACHRLFCVNCKVPWHYKMTCAVYNPPPEDVQLKSLATRNSWRQCAKCSHMIELDEGCYHMTCRCGFEFCYKCGAEWRNKNATCPC